jgi:hypothetical protein
LPAFSRMFSFSCTSSSLSNPTTTPFRAGWNQHDVAGSIRIESRCNASQTARRRPPTPFRTVPRPRSFAESPGGIGFGAGAGTRALTDCPAGLPLVL